MRSYCARGVLLTLGMVCLAGSAGAQDIGSPSLLPLSSQTYRTVPAAHTDAVVIEAAQGVNPAATEILDGPPFPPGEDYKQAMTQEWGGDVPCSQGVHGHGCNGCGYWFGSVGGLYLGSPTRHSTYLSYDSASYLPVLQTGQVTDQFSGGVDVTVGRMLGCGSWGAAFTYWGIYPAAQQADVYSTDVTGNLGSYLNFTGLDYNANPASNYWNNVFHQRIVTNQAINSVELNLLGNCCGAGLWGCSPWDGCDCGGHCGPRLGAGWTMGVRYFQFNDDFRFYSDNADNIFDGSVNEIQYLLQTRNNLLGFQLGGGLNYRVWNCFSLYGIGKAGIYGNNAIVEQSVYGSAGDATVNVGPYAGTAFRISTSETNLAFLGQLDMGGSYQINNCWSIQGGYRMVGITGLALTGGQIPSNFAYIPDAERVHSSDCLILHGGYIGATFCF